MKLSDISEAVNELEKFNWYVNDYDLDCGYVVLGGFIGGRICEEPFEENDFGVIVLLRSYIMGDWDYNKWDISFYTSTNICVIEMKLLTNLLEALKEYTKYPKENEATEEMLIRRKSIEKRIEKWRNS